MNQQQARTHGVLIGHAHRFLFRYSVVPLFCIPRFTSTHEAGKQLFTWKGRAMVTFIPPTQAALQNKRAVGWSCLGTDRLLVCLLLHSTY